MAQTLDCMYSCEEWGMHHLILFHHQIVAEGKKIPCQGILPQMIVFPIIIKEERNLSISGRINTYFGKITKSRKF